MDAISKVAKYLTGTEGRIITTSNFTKDAGNIEWRELSKFHTESGGGINYTSDTLWITIRHKLGENCSYFWNKMFIQFLGNFTIL